MEGINDPAIGEGPAAMGFIGSYDNYSTWLHDDGFTVHRQLETPGHQTAYLFMRMMMFGEHTAGTDIQVNDGHLFGVDHPGPEAGKNLHWLDLAKLYKGHWEKIIQNYGNTSESGSNHRMQGKSGIFSVL